ncbi:MICOS complex subunit mic60 [Ceratocystis pirilliformis]|uniref:MICOS complex subunit MIC60 n=1 Tax=Ceratocystis pirilliformis TaxID=259994 RepID=A0ABR3Z790_9PEZI
MLRSSISSVKVLNSCTGAGAGAAARQLGPTARRYFASKPSQPVTPAASSVAAKVAAAKAAQAAVTSTTPVTPTAKSATTTTVTTTPHTATIKPAPASASTPPPASTASKPAEKSTPPPPPQPPKKPGFLRRLRNFVFRLALLGVIGFAGGVWYSRMNDDFHDLFTEYVPFAEQAVLYFEERDFRKRFTDSLSHSKQLDATVAVPAQSGASWRVADSKDARRTSAGPIETKKADPKVEVKKAAPKPVNVEPKATPKPSAEVVKKAAPAPKKEPEFVAPQVNEPSRIPPVPKIDLLKMKNAEDPIVQDLVHIVNDLIVVINADNAQGRYGSTIVKAKDGVNNVLNKIEGVKNDAKKNAAAEVSSKVVEFEKAADEMVQRVEQVMVNQEIIWRQEFEQDMERIQKAYEEKVQLLQGREQKLMQERLNAQLMEQAVILKRQFTKEVKAQVEAEREGRLAKLRDLSAAVSGLEKLADGWNAVVDSNLQTQQLHVAVEAVRASLENTHNSKPFVSELVALKEIAAEDPVVDAAVASINPSAYQRGIAAPAELVDRFRRVASEVRKASLLPENAGVASHASSVLLSKVMFKKSGLADGDDVESILARAQTYLEEGDLDNAAREVNGLSGWAKMLSRDWLGEVRKVLEVQQALDVISTEARLQSLRLEQQD